MNWFPRVSPLVVLLGFLAGCSSTPTDHAQPASVKGTVTLDGKPMAEGVIRFSIPGEPPKSIDIKSGSFAGDAFVGKNRVEVFLMKDGPPHPMNPNERIQVNTIAQKFWGPNSELNADVDASGASDLKFAVTSK